MKILGITGALILVFIVIRYWANLEGFLALAFSAALPLIIGCVMAYVINILMCFFQNVCNSNSGVDMSRSTTASKNNFHTHSSYVMQACREAERIIPISAKSIIREDPP